MMFLHATQFGLLAKIVRARNPLLHSIGYTIALNLRSCISLTFSQRNALHLRVGICSNPKIGAFLDAWPCPERGVDASHVATWLYKALLWAKELRAGELQQPGTALGSASATIGFSSQCRTDEECHSTRVCSCFHAG